MKVCVIGGTGYFGGAVVRCLRATRLFDVRVGGRSGAVRVDLTDPSTFDALNAFDAVINCADALAAPPHALIKHALAQGLLFVETTADGETIESLLRWHKQPPEDTAALGRVILGMGIFPGVSNLLARELHDAHAPCHRLDVAIQTAQLSAGGRGMCALMAEALRRPAVYYENGERVTGSPVSAGPTVPFGHHERPTVRVGLPEAVMLHASTGVANAATYLAPDPSVLRHSLYAAHELLQRFPRGENALLRWTERGFRLARQGVFGRRRRTPVWISAMANDASVLSFKADDGIAAGGYAIAAALKLLPRKRDVPHGVLLPDEVYDLYEVVDTIREVASGDVSVHVTERIALPPAP